MKVIPLPPEEPVLDPGPCCMVEVGVPPIIAEPAGAGAG
jgi:hypothetical protein